MNNITSTAPDIDTILAQIDAHRLTKQELLDASFDSLNGLLNGEASKEDVTKATRHLKAWNKTMNGYLRALKAAAKGTQS